MQNMKSLLIKTQGIMLALSAVFAAFTATPGLAAAPYPSRPVQLTLATAAGGAVDIFVRMLAAKLTERLGKQVITEFRGGGGGIIATELVAKAAPDGYTLLLAPGAHAIQGALQKLPYDPLNSFAPIAKLQISAHVLVVHPSLPAHSVKELIALAKQKPGQLMFGATGPGGTAHLGNELFKIMAGIDYEVVHFKGASPAIIDLLGGHSHGMFTNIVAALPHIRSGKLRALGTGAAKRTAVLPDVPAIAESLPGFELTQWYGIVAPAGTPAPIVDRLAMEFKAIVNSNEVKKILQDEGADVDYLAPAEFRTFLEGEMVKWARVIKEANIKLE